MSLGTAGEPVNRAGIANVCFAAFMGALDSYIVNISLPTIAAGFGIGTDGAAAVVLVYVLFLTGTLLIFGKLCDRLGPRRILAWGYLVFLVGSGLCGCSRSLAALCASRAFQGVGSAMLTVSAYSLVPRLAPGRTGWAFGWLTSAAALGLTLGPPLGGLITGFLGWPWIFFINVPVGAAAVLHAHKALPPDDEPTAGFRFKDFDFAGAAASSLSLAALVFALNRSRDLGWGSPAVLAALAAGPVLLALFAAAEKRSRDPLLDVVLLRDRRFLMANLASTATFMLLAGSNFLMPFYLELVHGMRPQATGLLLTVYSVFYLLTTAPAGRASDRMEPRRLCMGAMLSAAGSCLFFVAAAGGRTAWPAVVFLAWLGVSFGFFVSPNNKMVMSLSEPERRGAAAGIFSLSTRISMILGVSVFEAVFARGLPHADGLAAALLPRDLLVRGFRQAYVAGAFFCALGLLFTALARRPQARSE